MITTPIPHAEGAQLIRRKPAVTRAVFDRLQPALQARAFLITGIEALDLLARVREKIATLPEGGDFTEIKNDILAEMSPHLIPPGLDAEDLAKATAAANRRAEMLLRLHGWQAYAQTQHDLMEEHADVFPYRQYLTSEDGRVRPTHAALNRKILPAAHPFWQNHTPPWEFGCRCDCAPLTREEVEEIRSAEKAKAPEDKEVLPPEQLALIEEKNQLLKPGGQGFLDLRTPREKNGTGYEWRPGETSLPVEQILHRFTQPERDAFAAMATAQVLEDGRTLAQWLGARAAAQPAVAIPRTLQSVLSAAGISSGEELTVEKAGQLIRALQHPDAVPGRTKLKSIKGAARKGVLSKQFVTETVDDFSKWLPPALANRLPEIEVEIKASMKGAAGDYTTSLRRLRLSKRALTTTLAARKTLIHELLHWVHEHGGPEIEEPIRKLWQRRTAGEKLVQLLPFNNRHILGLRDLWMDAEGDEYAGRVYFHEMNPKGTEVLTRHLEKLADPARLATHWNHVSSDGKTHWRETFLELIKLLNP